MLNIYRASAGSGKTFRLTRDYIHLLYSAGKERMYRKVLAVTFTNKATEEMKSRIVDELYLLASNQKSAYREELIHKFNLNHEDINEKARKLLIQLLHDYSAFSISTIDKFFQQVIRAFAREIGVHGGYNLELDTETTLQQATDNLFLELSRDENKQLLEWLTNFAEEKIDSCENWNTRKNIIEIGKEIFKENFQNKAEEINKKLHDREFLKTYKADLRSITESFIEKVNQHAKAALSIIAKHGLSTVDFKGGSRSAMKILETLSTDIKEPGKAFFSMAENVDNCYSKTTAKSQIASIESAYENGLQKELLDICSLFENDIVDYNSAKLILQNINTFGILSDLAVHIKKLTSEQNTMLISDSNLLLNKIIDNSETPFIYEKTGISIDHYMIDEFQDTSTLQWKNFKPLISNSMSMGKKNLVVGDVKQSIYRWRNSDWNLLDEQLGVDFPKENLWEEHLDTNWRSDKNIINFNNTFFEQAAAILQSKLNNNLEPALKNYPELERLRNKITHAYESCAQKVASKAGNGRVNISFVNNNDENNSWKENSLIKLIQHIEDMQERGYIPADICILVRDNKDARIVIEKLLSYKNNLSAKPAICYDIFANEGLLINSSGAVRFIIGMLSLFIKPDDSIQKTIVQYEYACGRLQLSQSEAINRCFNSNSSQETLFSAEELSSIEILKHLSLFELVEQLIVTFQLNTWNNNCLFIQAFQDIVFKYTASKKPDLNSFLNWWRKVENTQFVSAPDNKNSIRIMTIHKSKGLDFKCVIIPFCDWEIEKKKGNLINYLWCKPEKAPFNKLNLLPVEYGNKLENSIFSSSYFDEQMHRMVDNLNLAYVAFTRAKHELVCVCKQQKKDTIAIDKINSLSGLLFYSFLNQVKSDDKIDLSALFNDKEQEFILGDRDYHSQPIKSDTLKEREIYHYPSTNTSNRLHLQHHSEDYWNEDKNSLSNKINYGLIMHDILRQINLKEDQEAVLNELLMSGKINTDDKKLICAELNEFWKLPHVNEWFNPSAKVLTEQAILLPDGSQYRPDRIIIIERKAVIVDYKFGANKTNSHAKQVKNYMSLVEKMGYSTEGYICYVTNREIKHV